jgi:hypothetical protein
VHASGPRLPALTAFTRLASAKPHWLAFGGMTDVVPLAAEFLALDSWCDLTES